MESIRRSGSEEGQGNDIYIVLMSAYDYKNIEKEALMVGVNDFC